MNREIAFRWKPIEDLPPAPMPLLEAEWNGLVEYWKDQRSDAEARDILQEVEVRINREWAIETGAIEGVYRFDRGVTRTLIEKGIEAALIPHGSATRTSEWVAQVIRDQQEVLEHVFDYVGSSRDLTEGYIKETHAALMRNQETSDAQDQFGNMMQIRLQRGVYKERPNNPSRSDGTIHEYCPPIQVVTEMEKLVKIHHAQAACGLPAFAQAAWLHHAFAQIHPFQDGNGRVARTLTSLVLIKAGGFPFTVRTDDKDRYLDALEKADHGDPLPFTELVLASQRLAVLFVASAIADAVPPNGNGSVPKTVDDAVEAAKQALAKKGVITPAKWGVVTGYAENLGVRTNVRFEELAKRLTAEIANAGREMRFKAAGLSDTLNHPLQVHAANTREARLILRVAQSHHEIGVVIGTVGRRFRGLGVAAAFWDKAPIAEPFQFNHCEPYESTEARFNAWLDRVIIEGLGRWQVSQ